VLVQPIADADHPRLQEEEAPEAVDQAGHSREQLDDRDQRALQPARCVLGDEQGGGDRHRNREQEGDQRDLHGAEDQRRDAERLAGHGLRRELLGGEEAKPTGAQRGHRAGEEEEPDQHQHDERHEARREADRPEQPVGPGSVERDDAGDVQLIAKRRPFEHSHLPHAPPGARCSRRPDVIRPNDAVLPLTTGELGRAAT